MGVHNELYFPVQLQIFSVEDEVLHLFFSCCLLSKLRIQLLVFEESSQSWALLALFYQQTTYYCDIMYTILDALEFLPTGLDCLFFFFFPMQSLFQGPRSQ